MKQIGPTVYIVDDNTELLEVNSSIFIEKGCTVLTDVSFDDAEKRIFYFVENNIKIDLAIIDHWLNAGANKTGDLLVEMIHSLLPDTKTLLLTGDINKTKSQAPILYKGSYSSEELYQNLKKEREKELRAEVASINKKLREQKIKDEVKKVRMSQIAAYAKNNQISANKQYYSLSGDNRISPLLKDFFECSDKIGRKIVWDNIKYIANLYRRPMTIWDLKRAWKDNKKDSKRKLASHE